MTFGQIQTILELSGFQSDFLDIYGQSVGQFDYVFISGNVQEKYLAKVKEVLVPDSESSEDQCKIIVELVYGTFYGGGTFSTIAQQDVTELNLTVHPFSILKNVIKDFQKSNVDSLGISLNGIKLWAPTRAYTYLTKSLQSILAAFPEVEKDEGFEAWLYFQLCHAISPNDFQNRIAKRFILLWKRKNEGKPLFSTYSGF